MAMAMAGKRSRSSTQGTAGAVLLALGCFYWIDADASTAAATTPITSRGARASESAPPPVAVAAKCGEIDPTPAPISSSVWSESLTEKLSKIQDPFVAASPLSVAAVCRDGIALVSLHYVDYPDRLEDDGNEHDSDGAPALPSGDGDGEIVEASFDDHSSRADASVDRSTGIDEDRRRRRDPSPLRRKFLDLAPSSRGPLRIEPVRDCGPGGSSPEPRSPPPMALLSAGWRTDSMMLADAARELASEEERLYCLPTLAISADEEDDAPSSSSLHSREGRDGRVDGVRTGRTFLEGRGTDDGANDASRSLDLREANPTMGRQRQPSYHGRRIAEGLSYYLAKCAFSEGVRTLSCVGLLACGSVGGREDAPGGGGPPGSLYLVDAVGVHRVRAHAVGSGSPALHGRMAFVDFEGMDCLEGLSTLLRLIAEEGGLLPPSKSSDALGGEMISGDSELKVPMIAEKDEGAAQSMEGEAVFNSGGSVEVTKPAFVNGAETVRPVAEDPKKPLQEGLKWRLPSQTAVELAVIKGGEGRMRRIRLSSLSPHDK